MENNCSRIIRKKPALKDIYAVILSATIAEKSRDLAKLGADVFIAKGPFDQMAKHILAAIDQSACDVLRTAPKEIVGIESVKGREITAELVSVKRHLEAILNGMSDGIIELVSEGRIIFANPVAVSIMGLSEGELLGSKFTELINGGDRKKIEDLIKKTGENPKKVDLDTPVLINRRHISLSMLPVKEDVSSSVMFVLNDITEALQARDALRESEVRHRQLVENAVLGIFQVTKEGKILMVNKRMANIFGYDSQQDFLGNVNNILELYINPGKRTEVLQEMDNKGYAHRKKLHFKTKHGNPIFCIAYGRRYQSDDGEYIYEGILEDVTDKMKIEAQLQHAQKMEAIGTLAGGVAHDLNNILGGLVSYPELLLLQLPEDSPLRKSILTIQKSGEKAAAVVQDLLTLARRGVVVTEVVNLNKIIAEYLKSPEHEKLQSYHPGVHIETHLRKDTLNILGSSIHLSKTVMNLVSNAAEAMPEGGALTVSTQNRYIDRHIRGYDNVNEGDYVVLTISDTGIGISPEDMGKIFEPFYTKKKMGRSGTGLGMAVVWGTVKDHNGYIDVQSTEGRGTTFTLYFPATREKLSEDKSHLAIGSYSGDGESILVIDDVEEQRKIASGMLKELGYSVAMVSSGEEAVEYLKTNKADLLLLDMIMDPGIDGLDTYKRIIEIHHGQKAIIASGFSETDRVKELQSLGAGAYVRKPFLLEKIGLAVREELEK